MPDDTDHTSDEPAETAPEATSEVSTERAEGAEAAVSEGSTAEAESGASEEGAAEASGPPSGESIDAADFATEGASDFDPDATVNLSGDSPLMKEIDASLAKPTASSEVTRSHLKGLLEALIFASDHPQKANDLAKAASANVKEVRELLAALKVEYQPRGIQLDEVAGGWVFRTSSAYAPFVRDMTKQKPVKLSRAQVETLAILAYRQPVTRPEIDEIRGVDSGPVLKVLLERDLVRILGKKDEPGRPMIYGTTTAFLEFFGLKSLRDLPTLREFTELTEDSRRVAEKELGEVLDVSQPEAPVPDAGADPDLTEPEETSTDGDPSESPADAGHAHRDGATPLEGGDDEPPASDRPPTGERDDEAEALPGSDESEAGDEPDAGAASEDAEG